MAHVAKYGKSTLGNMLRHYERAKNEQGEYVKFGNENIDTSKSHLNYNLAEEKNKLDFIKQRTSEVKCLNRKDVKVMCSWIVTKPKDLPNDLEDKFFKNTYDFLKDRYGQQNVVGAYVHKDEVTPHMHFSFVPVKDNKKVSAKEVITRKDLKTFHTDLDKHLEKTLGCKVNVMNEATKEGNKKVIELKRETMLEESNNLDKKIEMVQNATKELSKSEEHIKGVINKLEGVEVKTQRFSSNLTISQEDYSTLRSLAKKGESKVLENTKLKAKVGDLQEDYSELNSKYNRLNERFTALYKENRNITKECLNIKKTFSRVEKAVSRLEMTDKVNVEIGKIAREEKNRGIGR